MFEQLFIIIGASIFGILGSVHLVYTLATNKFNARDHQVTEAMKSTSPVLTNETTIWKAWIGFNASHSLGAILIAAFFIPLAWFHMSIIRESLWFSGVPIVIGASYILLAKQYWFKIPLIGISLATACFIASFYFGFVQTR